MDIRKNLDDSLYEGATALYYEKWRNYNVMQGWNLPYSDQHIKDLNYVCIDEISNPNEWIQITPTLRFQWGYSGHVLGAVWF